MANVSLMDIASELINDFYEWFLLVFSADSTSSNGYADC